MCLLEKHFPASILTSQVHLLVHIVDEVEIAGVVHTRWMFFLERFMKVLKGFVRQKTRPEGSMAEGWLAQESCVFISEYLMNENTNIRGLWSTKDDERVVGEVPQGNGITKRFTENMREKVHTYCLMNCPEMQKWYEKYEIKRQEQIHAREEWMRLNTTSPIPEHLVVFPKTISSSWLRVEILAAKQRGENISSEELEFAYGPDWEVSLINQY